MQQTFHASTGVSRGFCVVEVTNDDAGMLITFRAAARASVCFGCGLPSRQMHSRYRRRLADLPISGRFVHMVVLGSYEEMWGVHAAAA